MAGSGRGGRGRAEGAPLTRDPREGSSPAETGAEQFRLFIEHTPAAVAMFDRELRYLAASRRWLADYRLKGESILGRSHYDIFPDIPERWREVHRRALAGEVEHCDEDPFEREDGSTDWIRWSVVPWRDAAGEIGGIMMLTEVITERRRLESRVHQAERLAALGRLVGGVAHDFNNLLSIILGCAELALAGADRNPATHRALTQIRQAALAAAQLTGQLLAFGRSQVLDPVARELDPALAEVRPMLQRLLPENIRSRWRLGAGDAVVSFDDTLLSTAVLNLVLNARDAMPDGGMLTVSTRVVRIGPEDLRAGEQLRPGPHVRIDVTDTGQGMDDDLLRRACEPYFTTKDRGRGTGLGLPSVLGVVEQHGGVLRLASVPDQGTTATVLLPTCPRPGASTEHPGDPASSATAARILVVEDVPELRDLIQRILSAEGHTVETAACADEAFERWDAVGAEVDLLITDILLPGMNGAALRAELVRRRPELRALFITGYDDRAREREEGASDVPMLRKPFGRAELVEAVRSCLARA